MLSLQPTAGYAIRLRCEIQNLPGGLGRLTSAIGRAGGDIDAVDLVEHQGRVLVRDLTVKCRDEAHGQDIARRVRRVRGIELIEVSDRTFDLHRGGKIEIACRLPMKSRDDLAMAYTPGVGRISRAIAAEPDRAWQLTIKANSVAVLTDGSAVLGLGNVGPEAAMPVMEGKAMLFKEFAGIDAYPICARVNSDEELIEVARAISPGFGGINLEDIAAPRCFEVEEVLRRQLDIPVFHDDQHGTAVVVTAALFNAARLTGRRVEGMTATVVGVGAAGSACARLLLEAGIGDLIAVDRNGIIDADDPDLCGVQREIALNSNRDHRRGGVREALIGSDVLIGVSRPGIIEPAWLTTMAKDAIVFALANPVPEIMPEAMPPTVRIVATGRSDYPNQINNVLVFPGFFRGLLDARAGTVDSRMKLTAAMALAGLVAEGELTEDYILPSVLDRRVAPAIANAVTAAVRDQAAEKPITPAAL
ncbi:MAG TPA: NAD-dependent malic enzyme [Candidatus Dormibacteraeota bacterium]|nr:NAD-dependent malic enzyme [Candidatus Dormibacteraeota bacterium]